MPTWQQHCGPCACWGRAPEDHLGRLGNHGLLPEPSLSSATASLVEILRVLKAMFPRLTGMVCARAGEMAQSLKHLGQKQEELSWTPELKEKSQLWWHAPTDVGDIPALGSQRQGDPWTLLTSQHRQVSK